MASDDIQRQLTSGEVLLIDTRQHWVAAIRYAIRPIVIAGLAVLLSVLNQWLRFDRLSFINDILHWIIVIAFVVAIVWLPIDLFRWWSRHFVLTNRRAMRLDGVIRKQSFDSSLEQINDIMLSQSFLGRRLGYADLTLLTANASNEAYEQLLDGPQFKRAVLDAKEAIRAGQPLEALPDGFVVRGGTNEASIRAAAKAPPAAEATTTDASPADPASPAVVAGAAAVGGTTAAAITDDAPAAAVANDAPTLAAPIEDTGADAPSTADVIADDQAFAAWPETVETDASSGSQAGLDAGAAPEAPAVAASDETPGTVEPSWGAASAEPVLGDEPSLAETTLTAEPQVIAPGAEVTADEWSLEATSPVIAPDAQATSEDPFDTASSTETAPGPASDQERPAP